MSEIETDETMAVQAGRKRLRKMRFAEMIILNAADRAGLTNKVMEAITEEHTKPSVGFWNLVWQLEEQITDDMTKGLELEAA
jgi:hypothetical protein